MKQNAKGALYFILILGLYFNLSYAHTTNNVPPGDSAYDEVDRLIGLGVIEDTLYGQRPWSQQEFLRIIKTSQATIDKNPDFPQREIIAGILAQLSARFNRSQDEEIFHQELFKRVRFGVTQLGSSARDVPVKNGVGYIDASIHPLVQYQNGLDFVRGQNFFFETEHELQLSNYLSFYLRPNYRFFRESSGKLDSGVYFQELYFKTGFKNVELQIGRDHLMWGQSEEGGFLFTNNARGMDMIKISNDSPFLHPWIFKYLGPSKYTFFVANLGSNRDFYPYAYLYGFKATYKPFHLLELGFSETIVMGGNGAPAVTWADPIKELFPIHKAGKNALFSDVSDHRFGFFDMRFTMPWLASTSTYFESFFDDSPLRALDGIGTDFWKQTALTAGVSVPRLTPNGNLSGSFEYRHLPPWAYRHGNWQTGYTLNQELIGDALGPDADGYYLNLKKVLRRSDLLKLNLSYESRGNSSYTQIVDPITGGLNEIVVKTPGETERRFRATARYFWELKPGFATALSAGYEFVHQFNFQNINKNNFLMGIQLDFQPRLLQQ